MLDKIHPSGFTDA